MCGEAMRRSTMIKFPLTKFMIVLFADEFRSYD